MFGFQLSLFYCFGFWIPIVNFLVFVCLAFWIPIINFLMLLHSAFWTPIANFCVLSFGRQFSAFGFQLSIFLSSCILHFGLQSPIFWILNFGFQFTSIRALHGYEPGMNIHCLIGNLKAGTSCLGVKCCPLIGHLGTVKGGRAHALWAGLGAQSICYADQRQPTCGRERLYIRCGAVKYVGAISARYVLISG